MSERARLGAQFFRRRPDTLARALLGKRLAVGRRCGIIVETEAYLGVDDQASHARFGPTARNRPMFGRSGVVYMYLCYGIHHMFNIVSGRIGQPGAVLIRAVEPGRGLGDDPAIARGPGKLTRALGLTIAHNGTDLLTDTVVRITRGRRVAPASIEVGPRVGVDYAGSWADAPLRFWIADHPSVSRAPRPGGHRARSAKVTPCRR